MRGTAKRAFLLLGFLSTAGLAYEARADEPQPAPPVLHFGGCGGAYFLAEPGDFWVEVEKYDLNRTNQKTFLHAILAGPDRSLIAEETLPDGREKGSGPGPIQRVRLNAHVARKGVYCLTVTVTEDRYGEGIAWGLRTNCPHYLIETSRGHRDAPHEEPFVLLSPETSGEVCFMPERRAFSIAISELAENAEMPALIDAAGSRIAVLQPDDKGVASATIPAEAARDAVPWRLHLPAFKATVKIDGVTRWTEDSDFPNLSLWTPRAESWFPFHKNRWPLTPYRRTVYAEANAKGNVEFSVHNNAFDTRTYNLEIEFPERPWQAELSRKEVTVKAGQTETVAVAYTVPEQGDAWTCHVRVTPQDTPDFSTYSTLRLRCGVAPAESPIPMPLVLKPYQHENEQFGYLPQYPLTNQIYFATDNRPFVSSTNGVSHWNGSAWKETTEAILPNGEKRPFATLMSKVAFDKNDAVYIVADVGASPALLYSSDNGETFRAAPLPGHGAFDIEQFSGHNTPAAPPPLARYTLTAKDPKLIWRRVNNLDLFLPEKGSDGSISVGDPVPVSKKCIGFSAHSGIPSSVVSREDNVHVIWAEATDPQEKVPGVPTFAATYDRKTKTLSPPALVGYGPPANDVHNTPCITIDSQGYLHALVGTHGNTFRYARSLQPNDSAAGWTPAEEIGPGLRQTYVGLVCGKDDTLHLVFRLWFDDHTYFPAGNYAALTYMSKRPNEPWSKPQPLVVAPFSEYSVYYHRLTIDRQGQLFLSYDYWSTYWFYRTDHRGARRALMMSPDGGTTWRLANRGQLLH